MNSLYDRLDSLRVRDVMSLDVVTVPSSLSMDDAAARMTAQDVTGAPVVDDQGRCVGMLSAADFLRRSCRMQEASLCRSPRGTEHVLAHLPNEALCIEAIDDFDITRYMSAAVQTIRDDAALIETARVMCAAHVHRLPVLDKLGKPIGIVSSLDLVSAMMNAMDEHRQMDRRAK
jgi:CBS-domain-containing membrane protein